MRRDKGLDTMGGKALVASSGKRSLRELEDVSNVKTSVTASSVSKIVSLSVAPSNSQLD